MEQITGKLDLELELSAPLSLPSPSRTGREKARGTHGAQWCSHYHCRRHQPISIMACRICTIYMCVVISGVQWTCCAFYRAGEMMDNCLAGQSEEVKGRDGGVGGRMMYACSKGMCHSWPGAHSQRWRWMPEGSLGEANRLREEKRARGQGYIWFQGRMLGKTQTWGLYRGLLLYFLWLRMLVLVVAEVLRPFIFEKIKKALKVFTWL